MTTQPNERPKKDTPLALAIYKARTAKGWTQFEAAIALELDPASYNRIERAKTAPNKWTLRRIVSVFPSVAKVAA
jgi:transcriptional regulator with XRE-family HTH domain